MDIMIILLGIAFLALLLLPIIVAYLAYRKGKGILLFINQNKLRDPRYFGRSFSSMVEAAIGHHKEGETIRLSKEEKVQDGA